MKKENAKKLILLVFVLVAFGLMSVAVPDFWNYDINYKNEKLDIHIPNTVEEDVQQEKFTLPVIYIYSYDIDKLIPYWEWSADGPVMPLREESSVDLYVFNREENSPEDIPSHVYYDEMMKLRGRTSSYMQDKKPFSLEFRDDEGFPVNYDFLNFDAESDFVFHAPYIDRSLIRNYIAYTLQSQLNGWSPKCQFAEVFVDTPDSTLSMEDYQGVYLIVEKIKQDKNRIAMGEYTTPESMDNIFYEGGNFIYKKDAYEEGYDTAVRLEKNSLGNSYSIAFPKAEDMDAAAAKAIKDELEIYEKALYEGTDEEFSQYYDIQQIADVMLMTELLKNYEGFSSSLYYYRPRGEKIKVIQWDFDLGTGNVDFSNSLKNVPEFSILDQSRVKQYMQHENFRNTIITRWKELRSEGGVLSEENIIALLDDAENQLEGAWQRNDEKFGYIFLQSVPFGNKYNKLENSEQERDYIEKFLIERGRWMDEHIDEIAQLY
ncbi:MAG: CotH kinase family protein [Oscillospiraceae bacterium]|nr:CotH kinase family protein [Oscillospiraceae bacterium]